MPRRSWPSSWRTVPISPPRYLAGGDEFFDQFAERHSALLAEQEAGTGAFYVLAAEDGSVLGRFNLVFAGDRTAELGYGSRRMSPAAAWRRRRSGTCASWRRRDTGCARSGRPSPARTWRPRRS